VSRIAPEGGYAFPEKEEYRQNIWGSFAGVLGKSCSEKHCLLLPSKEGREIEVALEHGFLEENLHVVDMNPAIVATLKRRFSRINTYGVTASRACARMAKEGITLSVANFDFTGKFSSLLRDELRSIAKTDCWEPKSFVGVTLFRGREAGIAGDVLRRAERESSWLKTLRRKKVSGREISVRDGARLLWVFGMLLLVRDHQDPRTLSVVRSGAYSSISGTTMLWCVSRLWRMSSIEQEMAKAVGQRNRQAYLSLRHQLLHEFSMDVLLEQVRILEDVEADSLPPEYVAEYRTLKKLFGQTARKDLAGSTN
jgi:hypothetical protein